MCVQRVRYLILYIRTHILHYYYYSLGIYGHNAERVADARKDIGATFSRRRGETLYIWQARLRPNNSR